MSLVPALKNRAEQSERSLAELADALDKENAVAAALENVETSFDRASADGVLDQNEFQAIARDLEALGIDAQALREDFGSVDSKDFIGRVQAVLHDAREAVRQSDSELSFQLEQLLSEHSNAVGAASATMKAEHDAYMTAIRNLVA